MSQSQMQEITCPKCGKKQFFRVWDSINTMEDPPLKEAVRNDEAFSFHCVDCGASAALHLLRCIIISSTMNRRKSFLSYAALMVPITRR